MSAIAFRGSTGGVASPAATSQALSNPVGTANDDVLIVVFTSYSTSNPTHSAPTGWTQVGSLVRDSACHTSVWWKRWQTGDPTSHTFTTSLSGKLVGDVAAYSGVHLTAAIHAQASNFQAELLDQSNHSGPSITTTVATWLINIWTSSTSSTWTPPGTEIEREDRRTTGGNDVSASFCDSNGDRAAGTQSSKTATSSVATTQVVMFQIALEPAAATPAAPVLSGTAGDTLNDLSWTAPAGTVNYDLYRGVGAAAPTLYQSNLTATTYQDLGLTNGTSYSYYVIAKNAVGSSPASNTVTLTPVAPAARTAKVRALRSTAIVANIGELAAYGTATTAPTTTTVAEFAVGDQSERLRNATSSQHQNPPAVGGMYGGVGWRDAVAHNVNEKVRYEAGTWTTRLKVRKTGQTLVADVTVRITWILYRVSATGGFIAEVGRAVSADIVVSTADLNITSSFTTTTPLTLEPGEKLHVEVYVQNIAAGLVAAATAAYNIVLLQDQNEANTGTAMTVQPDYTIQYARSYSVTGLGAASFARQIVGIRSYSVMGVGSAFSDSNVHYLRAASVVGTSVVSSTKNVQKSFMASGTGIASSARSLGLRRSASVMGLGSVNFVRQLVANRRGSAVGSGVAQFLKSLIFDRKFSATGFAQAKMRIDMPQEVLNRIQGGGIGEAPVTPEDIAAIANAVWDELTSEARAAGSYGDRVRNTLDATVSSRATPADVSGGGGGSGTVVSGEVGP